MSGRTASLYVDGDPMEIGAVFIHAQPDPYPGGHRYRLVIPVSLIAAWAERHTAPTPDALQDLQFDLGAWQRSASLASPGPFRFVLNSLEEMRRNGSAIELVGTCSEVVRPPHRAREASIR